MKGLRWMLGSAPRTLGARGIAGAVCLAASAFIYAVGVVPASIDLEQTRAEVAELSLQHREKSAGGKPVRQGPAEKLEAFYGFFPRRASLPDLLDQVYSAASRRSVTLAQGEYRLVREPDGRLARYQVTLPLRSSYPQLRGFLEDVLQQVPAAALESVDFKRETVATDTVEAHIKFTLFLAES
jgi:hypothetical protein